MPKDQEVQKADEKAKEKSRLYVAARHPCVACKDSRQHLLTRTRGRSCCVAGGLRYRARTDWFTGGVPMLVKMLLCFAAVSMMVCTYLLLFFSSKTFQAFQVTDSIETKLDGNAVNLIVAPLGWVAIGCLCASYVCLFIFNRWANYHVRHTPKDFVLPGEESPDDVLDEKDGIRLEVVVSDDSSKAGINESKSLDSTKAAPNGSSK